MNQKARMERFITRIKIEVSRPKKEIYKKQDTKLKGLISNITIFSLTQKPVAPKTKHKATMSIFLVSGRVMNLQ